MLIIYFGNTTLCTTPKSCMRRSLSGFEDRPPTLCPIPNCMAACNSLVDFCGKTERRIIFLELFPTQQRLLLTLYKKPFETRRLSRNNSSSPHDRQLSPTQMKPSTGTTTRDSEQLCKFKLKSIQNCRRHGSDKKNVNFKCDIDLGPT